MTEHACGCAFTTSHIYGCPTGGGMINLPMNEIPAAYTAAEVKVLTEAAGEVAYELGRREAFSDAIAYQVRIDGAWASFHPSDVRVAFIGPQAAEAASDATSGVPGHQEVSEADERLSKLLPTFCPTCGQAAPSAKFYRARCLDSWHAGAKEVS